MTDGFRLRVNVTIEGQGQRNYGNLTLSEEMVLDGIGFLEMCRVLGDFHVLASRYRKEAAP